MFSLVCYTESVSLIPKKRELHKCNNVMHQWIKYQGGGGCISGNT